MISGLALCAEVVSSRPICVNIAATLGQNPKRSIEKLGPPQQIKHALVPNPHLPGVSDTDVVLEYPRGMLVFRYLKVSGRYVLLMAEVSRDLFSIELRERIPKTVSALLNKWGQPDEQTDEQVRYYCTFEMLEWVGFDIDAQGQVSALSYVGYVD